MAEKSQNTKFFGKAMRGRFLPIALAAATGYGAGMLNMKYRQADESKSDDPDAKTLLQKSLEIKDATISAMKDLFFKIQRRKTDLYVSIFPVLL